MNETNTKKTRILNIVFAVLLFGGLWGIVEATLGSFLHLPIIHRSLFVSSTTILVPIAYFIMGACYKKTGTFRSVLYMGILAAGIKAITCAIFMLDFKPVYCILMEAAAMGGALALIRPKKVISYAGLAVMIIANTAYLGASTFLRLNILEATSEELLANIGTYVFQYNCVAIIYTFIVGAAIFGFIKLSEHYSWDFSKVKKIIYHPAFASSMAVIALAVTLVLR